MFYKCVISGYMCFISVLQACYLVISVCVATFGMELIFGLTGLRTNGPSE